jgi:GNAT superfamily N-acetyltransferase
MSATVLVRRVNHDEWRHLKDVRLRALADSPESFGSSFEREVAFDDAIWMSRAANGEGTASTVTWIAARNGEEPFCAMVTVMETQATPQDLSRVRTPESMELVGMWVDPGERGTGLADVLVRTAVDHTRISGHRHLGLWVAEPNIGAQRLYLRHGFVLTGEVDVLPSNPSIPELRMAVTFAVEQ